MTEPWPYHLPIFRRAHRALSPDGKHLGEIERACEVSMSNPTAGTLKVSIGLELERCSPSFIWSEDSRYLAVPQFFSRFGLFRRQRMLIVDVVGRRVLTAPETACYFQPESFSSAILVVTKEPFRSPKSFSWRIPEEMARFASLDVA